MAGSVTATLNGGPIVRVGEAKRWVDAVLRECVSPVSDRQYEEAMAVALRALGETEDAIKAALGHPVIRVEEAVDQRYISVGVRAGFDTILGYIARHNCEMLKLLGCPVEDFEDDRPDLARWAQEDGTPVLSVAACAVLLEMGKTQDLAYPIRHLERLYR